MIMIDTGLGPALLGGQEGDNLQATMKNVLIFGEAPSKDCQQANYCTSTTV